MDNQLYRQQIIDNYKNPMNTGIIPHFNIINKLSNTSCGDEVTVYINIKNKIIKNISFEGNGCAISIATTSLLTEEIKNMNVNDVLNLDVAFITELLGTIPTGTRIKCAMLSLDAIKEAIHKYINKY